jgi:hypothetical protein
MKTKKNNPLLERENTSPDTPRAPTERKRRT